MTPPPSRAPSPALLPVLLRALIPALLLLALLPGAAHAVGGQSTLVLDGPTGRGLARAGVTLSGGAGAAAFEQRAVLPVSGGRVSRPATVVHRGTLTLRRRPAGRAARTLTLTAVEVRLGARTRVSAILGGRRLTVLTATAATAPGLGAATGRATLRRTAVRFTRAAAVALRRGLALPRVGAGAAGTLTVDAELPVAPVTPSATNPAPTAPVTAGTRPATAVDVSAATLGWHVRDSFVQYLQGGEGLTVSGGATAGAAEVRPGSDRALTYDVAFAFASGWYDPPSGTALLRFRGAAGFRWSGRGIDYTTSDPEVELRGAASRATAVFTGQAGARFDGSRGTLVDLDPSAAASSGLGPDGRTRILTAIPGRVPADSTASVFAGFYFAGDPYGSMSLSFTPAE